MGRNRLIGNGRVCMAVCSLMAMFFLADAWGQSVAPINPAFRQWQKERKQREAKQEVRTNAVTRARRLLSTTGTEEEGELGFAPGTFDASYLSSLNVNSQQGISGGFARRYDLRELSVLTSVKNQNPYGTCWAHATGDGEDQERRCAYAHMDLHQGLHG